MQRFEAGLGEDSEIFSHPGSQSQPSPPGLSRLRSGEGIFLELLVFIIAAVNRWLLL
jgi:hypothetical protein